MRDNIEKWALCCPGPSLASYSVLKALKEFNPDFMVAVNGAILLNYKFDFWAVQDIEVFIHISNNNPHVITSNADLILWIPDRWLLDIPRDYPPVNQLFQSIYRDSFSSQTVAEFNDAMPFCREINWRECTMLTAIGLMIKYGAKVIKIYGADMTGEGYFQPGLQNERTRHIEKRWIDEAKAFQAIVKEAKNHGIEIIREVVL